MIVKRLGLGYVGRGSFFFYSQKLQGLLWKIKLTWRYCFEDDINDIRSD